MKINNFCDSIVQNISLSDDSRFMSYDSEMINLCQKHLIKFLKIYIEANRDKEIQANLLTAEVAEKMEELLGIDTLGDLSDMIRQEAIYYIRLFQLRNRHMLGLVNILKLYDSDQRLSAVAKLNSLIMLSICCYGAGNSVDIPLFGLTDHDNSPKGKEHQDLEVSILFLLRNMNDINLSLAEPFVGSPFDVLLSDVGRKKPVAASAASSDTESDENTQEVEPAVEELVQEKETDSIQSLFSLNEKIAFSSLVVLFIAIMFGVWYNNARNIV